MDDGGSPFAVGADEAVEWAVTEARTADVALAAVVEEAIDAIPRLGMNLEVPLP